MAIISFLKGRASFAVPEGTNLMEALLNAGLPVASSCDGEGVCAKCKLIIVQGQENLTQENDTENFLKESHDIPANMRISCQVHIQGDITVDATYW